MRYQNPRQKQALQMTHVICCLLFAVFCFIYLYSFQADLLSIAQHLLAHGRTHFHLLLYTSLLTLFLTGLGLFLTYLIHLPIRYKALLWLPSYALLGWLTDIHFDADYELYRVGDAIFFLLFFLLYTGVLYLMKFIHEEHNDTSPVISYLYPNFLIIAFGIILTMSTGNTNASLHHDLRIERQVREGKLDYLLDTNTDRQHPSRTVMSMRAFVLCQQGELGEKLFLYNNELGSDALLPSPSDTLHPINLPRQLRALLGGFPIHDMNATRFLRYLAADSLSQPAVHDYLLSSLLLDRNLDEFVTYLVRYYAPQDSLSADSIATHHRAKRKHKTDEYQPVRFTNLPRYYAEALLLYDRTTPQPRAVLDDAEILQNYLDYNDKMKSAHSEEERETLSHDYFENTYWSYYYHHPPKN